MDKETEKPVIIDNEEITAETVFTPEKSSGTVDVEFVFNGLHLKGKSVVIFETLCVEDIEYVAHADISDAEQAVAFTTPGIETSVTDNIGNKKVNVSLNTVLIDTVSYTNLEPGIEYTLKGVLMDKETEAPVIIDDEEINAETVFTPEKSSGEINVEFTFNGLPLKGKSVVVYESLCCEDTEIAVHADIFNKDQTVSFTEPEIATTAFFTDEAKESYTSEDTTVIDTVRYENLSVGVEYTLKGVLMDKYTSEPVLIQGKEVMSKVRFTPETSSGTITMEFKFDSTSLQGKSVVVFESLYEEDVEIASHADITDDGQTVVFLQDEVDTPVTVKTGDDSKAVFQFVIILFTAAFIVAFILLRRCIFNEKSEDDK